MITLVRMTEFSFNNIYVYYCFSVLLLLCMYILLYIRFQTSLCL